MAIEHDGFGNTKFTGIDKVKFYALAIVVWTLIIGVIVGAFFLRSYRWGSCP